jgi:hypothetical protein
MILGSPLPLPNLLRVGVLDKLNTCTVLVNHVPSPPHLECLLLTTVFFQANDTLFTSELVCITLLFPPHLPLLALTGHHYLTAHLA